MAKLIDLNTLASFSNKMKSTFATKTEVETALSGINQTLETILS